MALVSDIINEAFLDLNAIAAGESITSAEQADAFLRLQQMLDQWSAEQLSVYTVVHAGFTITAGTTVYTLGTAGSLATAAIPVRVTGAAGVAGAFRGPIKVVSWDEFDALTKDGSGEVAVIPEILAADNAWPAINIRLFPTPAASPATLWLDYWTSLAQFSTVGDTVTLPPGFQKALHTNLAVDLYPQYARPGTTVEILAAQAKAAKQSIIDLNAQILGMQQQQAAAPAPANKAA
jgi:hypothetical protein